ncbi:Panacea domain-containing protein [Kineosporia sp. A_224]|uniref:Panacea domain-containing protein n=1 Tax=Kineosporia sp. A_224 TaxID=1962180 RepID=UPI000B4ACC1B|nr:Panacea domain-containing protein [Kineosporia sp. A_224]
MTATIEFDDTKFGELLLYIAEESVGDPKFGKTKLNKILFYMDFLGYGIHGKPLTGAAYQRRPFGPVPKQITLVRNRLIANGDAAVEYAEYFGRPQERLVAKRPPNLSLFTQAEIDLAAEVLKALWNRSATEASELSHREPGWALAGDRDEIPYSAVFLSSRALTPEDIRRGQEIEALLAA